MPNSALRFLLVSGKKRIKMRTVLPTFVLVATCLQTVVKLAEMSGAKSSAAVKTPCDEIYFNQALAGKLKGQISLQQLAIANIRTEARQLWLGALAQKKPTEKSSILCLSGSSRARGTKRRGNRYGNGESLRGSYRHFRKAGGTAADVPAATTN
uniref:Variant surface glycoprotein n=1 Tax=Trypanosoma brucei TaxID=5691 RepID=A0A1V0FYS4_9TRYP|nr:variant surface glycoprotein [Trypanosoma brucei]